MTQNKTRRKDFSGGTTNNVVNEGQEAVLSLSVVLQLWMTEKRDKCWWQIYRMSCIYFSRVTILLLAHNRWRKKKRKNSKPINLSFKGVSGLRFTSNQRDKYETVWHPCHWVQQCLLFSQKTWKYSSKVV